MSLSKSKQNTPLVWAEVDLRALCHNLRVIRSHVGYKTQILAIVKADAYGHGMVPIAQALKKEGVKFFGVASIDEALTLRAVCRSEKILVLGTFHRNQIDSYIKNKVLPTVSSVEDAQLLNEAAAKSKIKISIHAKVDTGMGRLGVWYEEADVFFQELAALKNLTVEGIYTHFAGADHDKKFTQTQMKRFNRVIQKARSHGLKPVYMHAANSMGLASFKKMHLNLVRPGIILYGISPAKKVPLPKQLKPILTLKTRIAFIKEVNKGTPISYHGTYVTPSKTLIATLPIGYSHGYRVAFSNKATVQVKGKSFPVVGRVTMDQTLVDLGRAGGIERWESVTLIAPQKEALNSAQNLAVLASTIPYEILCGLHSRIPRLYIC